MEPRIKNITKEKLDSYSQPTRLNPHMIRYSVFLDNGEILTAITSLNPTVSEGEAILKKLFKTCVTGSVNQRKNKG